MIAQAVDLVDAFRRRALSPVEATRDALEAIEQYDDRVNAFVLVDAEGALAAAKESEARWQAGEPLGPGDGVPTSIKDALWTHVIAIAWRRSSCTCKRTRGITDRIRSERGTAPRATVRG